MSSSNRAVASGPERVPRCGGQAVGRGLDALVEGATGIGELAVDHQAALGQSGCGLVPLLLGPAARAELRLPGHRADRGQQHVHLAPVQAGLDQRRDVAVAPVLAEHGQRQPQLLVGQRWRLDRRPRRSQGSPGDRAAIGGRSGQLDELLEVRAVDGIAEHAAQHRVDRREPGVQHRLGRGERPGVGERPRHHRRGEVVERGAHDLGPDGAQRGGSAGEVAHPEALEPEGAVRLGDLRGEVHDGVQRLEHRPPSAGVRVSHAEPSWHGRQ